MKQNYFFAFFLVCICSLSSFSQSRVFLTSKDDNSLRIADSSTLTITTTVAMTASGVTIDGVNGLDVHPCTGVIYVILKISGQSGRSLGTTDTLGNVNIIGNTGDNFASIAFDDGGTLYGVTGDGAITSETLFTLDLNNATPTLVVALGNGDDGESIAFNPDDGFMYHWSGLSNRIFEKIDLSNNTITNINFLNPSVDIAEVKASVYAGNGIFGVVNGDDSLFSITTTGLAANAGVDMGFATRGFAFERDIAVISVLGDTSICTGDTTMLEAYAGTGYQWYRNGVLLSGETSQLLTTVLSGHYNCIVNKPGCTDSLAEGVNIEVFNLPSVSISPAGSVGICNGGSVVLTGSSGGSSQWYLNGQMIPFQTSNSITATVPGVYNMVKTNTNGCSDSASTGVEVFFFPNPVPVITGDTALCPGDTGTLTASTTFSSYAWSTTETTQGIEVPMSGTYTITVTDANGCEGSSTFEVGNHPAPFPMLGEDDTICVSLGGNKTLNPGEFDTYLWSDGSTDSTYFVDFEDFDPNKLVDTVVFTVTVTNEFGCVGSDEVTIVGQTCFGIEENNVLALVKMYPNPATERLTITSENVLESITILDVNGRVVLKKEATKGVSVNTSDWPAGFYTVMVTDGQQTTSKKLVIH